MRTFETRGSVLPNRVGEDMFYVGREQRGGASLQT